MFDQTSAGLPAQSETARAQVRVCRYKFEMTMRTNEKVLPGPRREFKGWHRISLRGAISLRLQTGVGKSAKAEVA